MATPEYEPVHFDEYTHLEKPFETSCQRVRFIEQLHLSVPIHILRYSAGGGSVTSLFLVKGPELRSESEILVAGAKLVQDSAPKLNEFHTRARRREFKEKLSNIVSVSPAVRDYFYKEMTMDASADTNPVMQERVRLMALGEHGIIQDLRTNNSINVQ